MTAPTARLPVIRRPPPQPPPTWKLSWTRSQIYTRGLRLALARDRMPKVLRADLGV